MPVTFSTKTVALRHIDSSNDLRSQTIPLLVGPAPHETGRLRGHLITPSFQSPEHYCPRSPHLYRLNDNLGYYLFSHRCERPGWRVSLFGLVSYLCKENFYLSEARTWLPRLQATSLEQRHGH